MTSNQTRTKSIFTVISRLVPGYKSYSEKQSLRTNDDLIRREMGEALRELIEAIRKAKSDCLARNDLDSIAEFSKIESKVTVLESSCISAARGYSAVFEENEIDNTTLEQILEIDRELLDNAEKSRIFCGKELEQTDISDIETLLKDVRLILNQRESAMRSR